MSLKRIMNFKLYDYFASAVLLFMLLLVFGNVLGRYVLSMSWAFTEEVACGLLVLMALLGAAASAREGGFLSMDIILEFASDKYKKIISTMQAIAIMIFLSLLFVLGIGMAWDEWVVDMRTTSLGWPEAVFGAMLPLGAIFVVFASIQRIFLIWGNKGAKDQEDQEVRG